MALSANVTLAPALHGIGAGRGSNDRGEPRQVRAPGGFTADAHVRVFPTVVELI